MVENASVKLVTLRNDNVSKRLKLVEGDGFVYHMTNQCYKKYTMKPTLAS